MSTAKILPWLGHKFGGTITRIVSIQHTTERRVASWEYVGRVEWNDGTVSERALIHPSCLCYDECEPGGIDRVRYLSKRLTDYLDKHGTWHDSKHTRDGRVYSWTPHQPNGSEDILDHE